MKREINIRLNANRAKAVHTGHKFASGDKGIVFRIAVDELDTTGTTAKIVFKRSNGTSVEAGITETAGIYSYTTLGNEFAVVGQVTADVKFYENEKRVSTCTFVFDVTADTLDGLGNGAAGYSDTLERMKKSMEQAEADILAAKDELEKRAEEILQQMKETAENAEDDLEETEKKMADLSADLEALYQEYMDAFGNVGPFNPRGPYSETETYTVRDMVSYNDASWICYRNCTGATPAEESDCWQKFAVEAEVNPEEFLKKTDVDTELNEESEKPIANKAVAEALENVASKEELCALPMKVATLSAIGWYRVVSFDTSSNAYGCIVSLGNGYGSGGGTSFVLGFNGSHGKNVITQLSGVFTGGMPVDKVRSVSDGDKRTHIEIHYSKDVSNRVYVHVGNIWVRNSAVSVPFTAGEIPEGYTTTEFELVGDYTPIHKGNYSEYALPITGGKVSKAGYEPLLVENTQAGAGAVYIRFLINGISKGQVGVSSEGKPVFYSNTESKSYSLLHIGNKPTGTYTGNGDATTRTINTGGIGNVLYIWSENGNAIVMPTGGFVSSPSGGISRLASNEARFANGVLTLTTTNAVINANGTKTDYQV